MPSDPELRRIVSDLIDQLERERRDEREREPQQAIVSGFTYVDPHKQIFTTTGSTGSAFGSAVSVDLSDQGVPQGIRKVFCYVQMTSSRAGADSSDSQLAVQWKPSGGTDWLYLAQVHDVHELVDDATNDDFVQAILPMNGSTKGQMRVFETNDTWTYTVTMFAYE